MAGRRKAERPKPKSGLLGAGARIKLDSATAIKRALALRKDWQRLCWLYYDAVGEAKYVANWKANVAARVRLFVAMRPELPGQPPQPLPPEDGRFKEANELLDDLRGPSGTHAEMIREMVIHFFVPGECFLVGLAPRPAEVGMAGEILRPLQDQLMFIASIDEFKREGDDVVVESAQLPFDEPKITLGTDDFWARMWRRHPRKGEEADSSMRGALATCEELLTIDRAVQAQAASGISTRKLLAIPDDITPGAPDPTQDESDGEADADPLLSDIMTMFTTPKQTPGTAAEVAPYLIRYPVRHSETGELKGKSGIEVIDVGRAIDEMLDKRTDRALRRLAQQLDVNMERLLGLGQANHWGGGQIEESDFRGHVEPDVSLCCDSLTEAYFAPACEEAGLGDLMLWYDASTLVVRTDQQKAVNVGHRRFLVKDETWRRVSGFNEDDAPDAAEIQRRIEIEQQVETGGETGVDTSNPTDEPAAAAQKPVTASAKRNPLGARLRELDQQLRLRTFELAEAALERAIERAESKLVSKARTNGLMKQQARSAERGRVLPAIGGTEALTTFSLTADDLVGGSFDGVRRAFINRVRRTAEAVERLVKLPQQFVPRSVQRAEAAGAWLARELELLAMDVLLRPRPVQEGTPVLGEIDPDARVPFGLIREAVARAGGATFGDNKTLTAAGFWEQALGFAISELVMGAMEEENGATVEGWVWVYGEFPRSPFPPHEDLDGVFFVSFTDEVLLNPLESGWPGDYLMPGDHDGCLCDVEPVIVETNVGE